MKQAITLLLTVIMLVVPLGSSAANVDISDMTFDELLELKNELDMRIRALYPEYDYVLSSGEYFVGIDVEKGNVMLYYLRNDEEVSSYCAGRDANDDSVWHEYLSVSSPREKCSFEDDQKIIIERGPIGIKYLDD